MEMERPYARDPVVLYTNDAIAYSRRAVGFYPLPFFFKDETANEANQEVKKTYLFFDYNARHVPCWQTIRELAAGEITPAEIYDLRHRQGRWADLHEGPKEGHEIKWLEKCGYVMPPPHARPTPEYSPMWPPMFEKYQRPLWESYLPPNEIQNRALILERDAFVRRIKMACGLCSEEQYLVHKDGIYYAHGKKYYKLEDCKADALHRQRGTLVPELHQPV